VDTHPQISFAASGVKGDFQKPAKLYRFQTDLKRQQLKKATLLRYNLIPGVVA
jgi:hypothetical protein